jgi:DtxR family Mn-dependent transcriptional regulator
VSGERPPQLREETVHHYLETIFYISNEGETVRPGRIAEWMGVSAPTVSATLARLSRDGWIDVATDRSVSLTAPGEASASKIVRVHRLLERWLTDVLGMDWASADEEAQRLAPGMAPDVADRLEAHLGFPDTCPHGNVIPGRQQPYGTLISLAELQPGQGAVIRRISEVAEHDAPDLLRHLDAIGMVPGTSVRVEEGSADLGAVTLKVGSGRTALGPSVASLIWVEVEALTG